MPLTEQEIVARKAFVGASDVAACIGLNPWRTPLQVWLDKRGLGEPFSGNEFTKAGDDLEPMIAQRYERENKVKLIKGKMTLHKDVKIASCTPDYLLEDGCPVQIKASFPATKYDLEDKWGDAPFGHIPDQYAAQVAWEMSVLDVPRADLAVLINGYDFRVYHLERDGEVEDALIEKALEFWKYVETDTPPPPLDNEDFKNFLTRRWNKTTGKVLEANESILKTIKYLRDARMCSKEADDELMAAQNLVKELIGPDDSIDFGEGKITWRFNKDGKKTNWELVAKHLLALKDLNESQEIIERFTETKPGARVMRCLGKYFKGSEE